MRVRIGIADTDKLVELEVDDIKAFTKEIERAMAEASLGWFTDTRGRSVGIPAKNVAFIEIDDAGTANKVGFSPAV